MFQIPELRRRILFTLGLLVVYRLGGHILLPGIDPTALSAFMQNTQGTLVGLYDVFVGGNLSKATIFALGIMPYISASIVFQLLGAVIPYFEKLQKEGEEGRKKITQYTRYATVPLSFFQALGVATFLERMRSAGGAVVPHPSFGWVLLACVTLTTGTIFIMWLGEQITERGIGNGISLIIFIGIVARFPNDIINTIRSAVAGQMNPFKLLALALVMVAVIAVVVAMTQATRKIPVQYAKRIVGRKMYGGQNTHIPLRVNTAGVIPIIFAQSLLLLPGTIATFASSNTVMATIKAWFSPSHPIYLILYSIGIIFFTYFYTAVVLNPIDLADNMKKYGGFIPGVRPGKKTAEYVDRVLTRITLPGAIFLAAIAVLPDILVYKMNVPFYFGGTSLLIVVGVALDTLQQIESHLLMRHYEGFMKRGKIRGRRFA
jgi:preprotein translocase subunit SecY